jgi:hypothetical protein
MPVLAPVIAFLTLFIILMPQNPVRLGFTFQIIDHHRPGSNRGACYPNHRIRQGFDRGKLEARPCHRHPTSAIAPLTPSGSTVIVDDSRASRVLACSPPAPGLSASSCSYGQRFASGPFAPVPHGSSLTFATVVVISPSGTFYPERSGTCQTLEPPA